MDLLFGDNELRGKFARIMKIRRTDSALPGMEIILNKIPDIKGMRLLKIKG